MENIVKIKPIYGWGWFDKQSSIEVPEPFEILANNNIDGEIAGIITTPNHIFNGYEFRAWPRHTINDGDYNCELIKSPAKKANGYCKIDINKSFKFAFWRKK